MAALIYVADASNLANPSSAAESVMLESDGIYWFLYRYFEGANLNHASELIDLYGGGTIEGYQLHRLRTELRKRSKMSKPNLSRGASWSAGNQSGAP
jgi:hypothetical protein